MSLLPPSLTTASQNLNARDPSARLTRLACSSVDLLWVMTHSPGEGTEGTPISVNFSCKDVAVGIHIRLVVGRRAVTTHVHEIDTPGCGHWQLTGRAPAFSKQKSSSPMVPLTIQAVDKENRVVDSVTFGDFVYHDAVPGEPSSVQPVSATIPPTRPSLRINAGEGLDRPSKRRSPYSQPQTPPSSDSEYGGSQSSRPHAHPLSPTLRRASRQMGSDLEDSTQAVILDITTPLDNFSFDWEESELHAGRRLVRFRRLQDGNRLIVSAEKISQAEYNSDDIVISCIYREETDSCCVTSVDIIHLLQRLVDADFEVDEKNRIRRNLEGLRPTTVSKTRPGFESFFQRIMDFPDPKPRKIEKDVKVFDWKLLPHALDKILSKYSLCGSPTTDSPRDEVSSPLASITLPQETPISAYDDNSSLLRREPGLDALYLSHMSPVIPLGQFAPECSPDSAPEMHRRASLHEELLQPVYLDSDIMQRYYAGQDIVYGMPSQSPMYSAESSGVLGCDTSPFIGDQAHHDWGMQSAGDVMLVSPHEPIYSPGFAYNQSDSAESIDIPYPVNTYDAFELQSHSTGPMLASHQP